MTTSGRVLLKRPILWLAANFIGVSGPLVAATLWVLRSQAIESGRGLNASFAYHMMEQTANALQSVDQALQLGDNDVAKLATTGALNVDSANALVLQLAGDLARQIGGVLMITPNQDKGVRSL